MTMGHCTQVRVAADHGRGCVLCRSKVQAGLFPDVPRRWGVGRIAARPGVPRRAWRANLCAREKSAYHGTLSAGGGRSHDDRNCSRSTLSPIITPRTMVFRRVDTSPRWTGQSLQLVSFTHAAPVVSSIPGGAAHITAWLCALPFP